MVNVFVVHSGRDYDFVKDTVEPFLRGEPTKADKEAEEAKEAGEAAAADETVSPDEKPKPVCNANILTMKSGVPSLWKREAKKVIRMAQVVLVIVGEDACNPGKEKSMGWEVQQALKYNKLVMIYNTGNNRIPDYLMQVDHFTKLKQQVSPSMTLEAIKARIDNYARGYYDIFTAQYSQLSDQEKVSRKGELVDQYKMFQKTSEDLVARRQSVNSFYISVNGALVSLVGLVLGLVEAPANLLVVMFMCAVGIIIDSSWISILDAYGTLNAAKMKVINLLEEQLPVALYDVEWQIMSDKLNSRKYISFTDSEKRVPRIFRIIYSVIFLGVLIYGAYLKICVQTGVTL